MDINSPGQPVVVQAMYLDTLRKIKHFYLLGNSSGCAKTNRKCCWSLTEIPDAFMVIFIERAVTTVGIREQICMNYNFITFSPASDL